MKKLINTFVSDKVRYEVVHEDDYGYLVNHPSYNPPGSYRFWVSKKTLGPFKEYKEPRRIEGWVNVYSDETEIFFGGIIHKSEDSASKATHLFKKIGTVKFEWVEGQT